VSADRCATLPHLVWVECGWYHAHAVWLPAVPGGSLFHFRGEQCASIFDLRRYLRLPSCTRGEGSYLYRQVCLVLPSALWSLDYLRKLLQRFDFRGPSRARPHSSSLVRGSN